MGKRSRNHGLKGANEISENAALRRQLEDIQATLVRNGLSDAIAPGKKSASASSKGQPQEKSKLSTAALASQIADRKKAASAKRRSGKSSETVRITRADRERLISENRALFIQLHGPNADLLPSSVARGVVIVDNLAGSVKAVALPTRTYCVFEFGTTEERDLARVQLAPKTITFEHKAYSLKVRSFGLEHEPEELRPMTWVASIGTTDTADDLARAVAFAQGQLKSPPASLIRFTLHQVRVGLCKLPLWIVDFEGEHSSKFFNKHLFLGPDRIKRLVTDEKASCALCSESGHSFSACTQVSRTAVVVAQTVQRVDLRTIFKEAVKIGPPKKRKRANTDDSTAVDDEVEEVVAPPALAGPQSSPPAATPTPLAPKTPMLPNSPLKTSAANAARKVSRSGSESGKKVKRRKVGQEGSPDVEMEEG